MAEVLNYAPAAPRVIGRRILATLPLALGAVAYAALCWPAMHRRGYPPMDHFWLGMAYLWVFPIPLFTLFCPPGGFCRRALAVYALVTGYVDACTIVNMVPHRFNPLGAIFDTLYLGPIHLLITGVVGWVVAMVFGFLGVRPSDEVFAGEKHRPGLRASIALAVLAAAIAFPFAFRAGAIALDLHAGRARADADWAAHDSYILSGQGWMDSRTIGNHEIYSWFDDRTGLPLRIEMRHEYEAGYKQRIEELIATNGLPPWSHKSQLVADDDLLEMFSSPDLHVVDSNPYDPSPNVVIASGSVTRWGCTFGGGSGDLFVDTKNGGNFGQNYYGKARVGRLAKYPGVIFIRGGDEWVIAASEDGWILKAAMRAVDGQ